MRTPKIPRPIGDWTALKLEHLSAYLEAFARATTMARQRYYIDAMAGCGECVMVRTGAPTPGSARRALSARPPFTGIHLVEMDPRSATHLQESMRPYKQVSVYQGDCNVVVPSQVLPKISRSAPTLAFIDPTGAQLTWELLKVLAGHRRGTKGEKIELLILFAFDMFINRWMRNPAVFGVLDAFFGTTEWRDQLAASQSAGEGIDARRERFLRFYVDRLRSELKYQYVDPYGPLKKGRRVLYHMVFATDHPVAAKIMGEVWAKHRELPGTLFYQRKFDFTAGDS